MKMRMANVMLPTRLSGFPGTPIPFTSNIILPGFASLVIRNIRLLCLSIGK